MKTESAGEYVFVIVSGHPMADSRGRVLEHRYVMSESIGRILTEDEVVHHIDGDTRNNDISNLKLMLRGEHSRLHSPVDMVSLVCCKCGVEFERPRRKIRSEMVFCSKKCRGGRQVGSKNLVQPEHGTYNRYRSGCRCFKCRRSNADRVRKYRHGKRA